MEAIEIRAKLVSIVVALLAGLIVLKSDVLAAAYEGDREERTRRSESQDAMARVQSIYSGLGMNFVQNLGQLDRNVAYYEKSFDHRTYFAADGVTFELASGSEFDNPHALRLLPINANKDAPIAGEKLLYGKANYFIGSDASKWRTQIPVYEAVVYKNIYENVDLKFYGNNNHLEYDLIVKPGADPSQIEFALEGVQDVKLIANGDMALTLGSEKIVKKKPVIYQVIDNRREIVAGNYRLHTNPTAEHDQFVLGFELGEYDRSADLVIDPVIVYSTYLGGKRLDAGYSIIVDNHGYAYVAGRSQSDTSFDVKEETGESPGFPVSSNAFQQNHADVTKKVGDGIVIKFNIENKELVYSTFIGGDSDPAFDNLVDRRNPLGDKWNQSGLDEAMAVAVDDSGNAYVTGFTLSKNFPTTKSAFQREFGGGNCGSNYLLPCSDAFVAKLNSDGSKLLYSTYVGGRGQDRASAIMVDQAGSVYVAGSTASDNFPVTRTAYQKMLGGNCKDPSNYFSCSDAFVFKLNPSGSSLVYSTFVGGSQDEQTSGMALDNNGNVFIVGNVKSDDFPVTAHTFKQTRGNGRSTTFVTKLNAMGSNLIYSTYLGGNDGDDTSGGIAVDREGLAYITGSTSASDFPTTPGVFGSERHAAPDAFVVKINEEGSALKYSTLLGGDLRRVGNSPPPVTYGSDIAIDEEGNAYITGVTTVSDFPKVDPIVNVDSVGQGVIIAKINPSGKKLLFSTDYTSKGYITATSIAIDTKGDIYLTGTCDGLLPVKNPMMNQYGGGGDAFIAKISLEGKPKLVQLD